MAVKNRRVRLITVVGPRGKQDVVAAADASLVFLLPVFVGLVGDDSVDPDSPRWSLYDREGRALRRVSTLADEQVFDGSVLQLALSVPAAPPTVPYPTLAPAGRREETT
jgi:hypothetical protein